MYYYSYEDVTILREKLFSTLHFVLTLQRDLSSSTSSSSFYSFYSYSRLFPCPVRLTERFHGRFTSRYKGRLVRRDAPRKRHTPILHSVGVRGRGAKPRTFFAPRWKRREEEEEQEKKKQKKRSRKEEEEEKEEEKEEPSETFDWYKRRINIIYLFIYSFLSFFLFFF